MVIRRLEGSTVDVSGVECLHASDVPEYRHCVLGTMLDATENVAAGSHSAAKGT